MDTEFIVEPFVNVLSAAFAQCGVVGSVTGAALAPIVTKYLSDKNTNPLEERSKERMRIVANETLHKLQERLDRQDVLRDDSSYYSMSLLKIPKAQELFEGILLKVRDEYQSKKLPFYSSFFANLCFDESVSLSHANFLLQTIDRLSYRQLSILSYLSDDRIIDSGRWDAQFKVFEKLCKYYDFYSEYTDLYNLRLIVQAGDLPGFSLGMSSTKISPVGKRIVSLLDMNDIPQEDCDEVDAIVRAINSLIG